MNISDPVAERTPIRSRARDAMLTPLSFFTSLLALPIDRFQQHQQNNAYPSSHIGMWLSEIAKH